MTTPRSDPDTHDESTVDELATAMLDGELTAAERSMLEGDAGLAALVTARAEQLGVVVARAVAPVDLPESGDGPPHQHRLGRRTGECDRGSAVSRPGAAVAGRGPGCRP